MPKKKSTWASRMKKNIKSLLGPGHSPAGKKYTKKQKPYKTLATKGIEDRLRRAGLTEKEIKRLRGM
jgi:hypothetical protein